MELIKFKIPKSKFNKLSKEEQVLFVQFGCLHDEIMISQKCFMATIETIKRCSTEVEKSGQTIQLLFFAKLLAEKLHGGWEMMQRCYFGSKLSKKFDKLLNEFTKKDLKEIKTYFNKKKNLISSIRNAFCSHSGTNEAQASVKKIGERAYFYINKKSGNCLFQIGDDLINAEMLSLTGASDLSGAIDKLFDDLSKLTNHFSNFTAECLYQISEKMDIKYKDIEIQNVSKKSELNIPYFIEPD